MPIRKRCGDTHVTKTLASTSIDMETGMYLPMTTREEVAFFFVIGTIFTIYFVKYLREGIDNYLEETSKQDHTGSSRMLKSGLDPDNYATEFDELAKSREEERRKIAEMDRKRSKRLN